MKKQFSYLLGLLGVFAMTSCETDIETNAEYQDITVVYGLLDPDSSTHYIKVTKAFLTDGDANDAAADASNYDYAVGEITVNVDEYTEAGVFVKSHSLSRTENDIPKDAGIFDNNTNVLYKFDEAGLNEDNEFRLTVYNASLDKTITGKTTIPKGASVTSLSEFNKLKLHNGNNFGSTTLTVAPKDNVGRIKADMLFYYTEVYMSGDSVEKFVRVPMGEQLATSLEGNTLEFTIDGSAFFDAIQTQVDPNTANLDYRRVGNCKVEATLAGIDLSTYMSVNEPSLGVSQTSQDFTNLTNGLGLFSSRTVNILESNRPDYGEPGYSAIVNMSDETVKVILGMGYGFCSDRTGVTSPFQVKCWN